MRGYAPACALYSCGQLTVNAAHRMLWDTLSALVLDVVTCLILTHGSESITPSFCRWVQQRSGGSLLQGQLNDRIEKAQRE